jgi:hypothetical protein
MIIINHGSKFLSCLYFFQVINFVKLAELYYAASHGMDIMGPTKNQTAAEKVREIFLH